MSHTGRKICFVYIATQAGDVNPSKRSYARPRVSRLHPTLRGRRRFDEEGTPAPFPSALVMGGGTADLVAAMREALPEAWHVNQWSAVISPHHMAQLSQ